MAPSPSSSFNHAKLHFPQRQLLNKMASEDLIDLLPHERSLRSLATSLRANDTRESWSSVETTSKILADNLRTRNGPIDHHTILGKTELPQTLSSLLSLAMPQSQMPDDNRTVPILEILRAGANLCMDHDDNRSALLEVGFPQAVISLLEGYSEIVPSPPSSRPLPLPIAHLKIIRTSIGVLLNASLGYDPVKSRLNSLESALTILKLSAATYPPKSWTMDNTSSLEELSEVWDLRSGISNWSWRTIAALKDGSEESLQIFTADVLPWITPPLAKFCPSDFPESSSVVESNEDLFGNLVQTDFDFLEEACTLIESLSLDSEDFPVELARKSCYPVHDQAVPCLTIILDFIEHGSYPVTWQNPIFDEERRSKQKAFDVCKAALIKSVVEVFGEAKNEEVLWVGPASGGPLIERMVGWIRQYVETTESPKKSPRDDLAICASLSLGNLIRKVSIATALLSPPHSLAPILASDCFLSPSTDIKLKHGILGLLKHLAQFSKLSPLIPSSFADVHIIERITASGVWDEKSDAMADVVQLSAIGVVKHMCNASLDHTFALVAPLGDTQASGLSQVLALIKRSDSVPIKSEGSRVLVNLIKSLWYNERGPVEGAEERQRRREECISVVLIPEYTLMLASLVARSGRYPILVNEGIVAISLLSTHKLGGSLVLEAITTPLGGSPIEEAVPTPPTPPSGKDGLLVPRHALDMLISVLRNVDNPVNFPVEVRINACTFFLQLHKQTASGPLAQIREMVIPVVEHIVEDSKDVEGEERLFKAAKILLENWANTP